METDRLRYVVRAAVATVTLRRPDVRNALDAAMLRQLADVMTLAARDAAVRVVVIEGEGPVFCAGADLQWMRASLSLTEDENRRDARVLADALAAVADCPRPVIARVHGAAMGGGSGLVSACDIVVATEDAKFAFSETKLGLVPAMIAPFVVPRIGSAAAGRYFVTAEVFGAARARDIGLVHEVVPADRLDATIAELAKAIANNGPQAVAEAKALLRALRSMDRAEGLRHGIEVIARLRTSAEGQEGVKAFLEKRPPGWVAR